MMLESIDSKAPPAYAEATAPPQHGSCDTRVRLNVAGQKFTTWASTLAKLPGTRLSGLTCQDPAYDQEEKEYFFDRNPWLFPYVLDAYRHGEVHFPASVCVPAVQAELLHWGLSEQLIPPCCWNTSSTWAGHQETSALVDAALRPSSPPGAAGWRNKANFVWRFLDDARSSKFAAIWLVFYTLLLMVSLVVITVASIPKFVHYKIIQDPNAPENSPGVIEETNQSHTGLRDTNIACTFFFLFELLIRFSACPEKRRFFCSIFNIIDLLHVIPMFIYCCVALTIAEDSAVHWPVYLLAISTFFRAVRILKISQFSWKMQALLLALRVSAKELLMLLIMEVVFMVAFASAVYFSESDSEQSHYRSIHDAMWWSIITLTTVGYGDMRPISGMGKFIGGLCSLTGIVLIALAVAIIVNNFRRIYANSEVRMRLNQRAIDKKVDWRI